MKKRWGRGEVGGWVRVRVVISLTGVLYCVSSLTLLLASEEEESDEEEERPVKEDKAPPAKEAPKAEDDVKPLIMIPVLLYQFHFIPPLTLPCH